MAGRKPPLKNATSYANKLKELGCKNIETYRSSVSGEIKNKTINISTAFITVDNTDSNVEFTSLFRYSKDPKHITKKVLKFLLNNNGDFIMDKEGNVIDNNITKQVVLKAEASAEMRPFSYNGKVITASSREEAIKRISATQNKIASSKCIVASRKTNKNRHRIEVPEGIEQEVPKGIVFDNYGDVVILYPETNEKAFDSMFEEAEVRFDDGKEFQEFVTKNKQSMQDFVRILNELKNNAFFKEITKNMN